MKKSFITFIFAISSLFSMPARADLVLGADIYQVLMDTSQELDTYTEDNYAMIAAVLGFDFKGVGVEGFYQISDDNTNNYGKNSKLKSYGADFVLRLPTSEYIDFVASAGYVKYTLETIQQEYKTDGLRLGLGLQFNLNKYIGLRAMYHYSALTEEINEIKTINEFNVGLRLKF